MDFFEILLDKMYLRLPVTQEVPFLLAVLEELGAVLRKDATGPHSRATFNFLVLHSFSTHPHPLTSQVTQARPHLLTFSKKM